MLHYTNDTALQLQLHYFTLHNTRLHYNYNYSTTLHYITLH